MKLSACLIVKNEEDVIERCLRSVTCMVDEVIVVDTGSTDGTIGIVDGITFCCDEKIELHHIPWNGSFADMRNRSMDLATGDVLFIIDADEYVEDQDWSQIRKAINMPDFMVGMVQVLNTTSQGPVRGERVMQPRLFLNHPEIRYKYAVHNQIDDQYLSYARKFKRETGRDAVIVSTDFEIMHTGYDLSPDQVREKYSKRVDLCRKEVERAIESGSKRDEAYYKYQLALFLTMLKGGDEPAGLWADIEYENLNVFNRWYAKYIASRAHISTYHSSHDINELFTALSYASDMFEAMSAEQTGYMTVPEEPVSWQIVGVIMCEIADVQGDEELRNQGIVMMIEAFLRSLTPPQGSRCVVNSPMLYSEIRDKFDPDSYEYSHLDTDDLQQGIKSIRSIQRHLVHFDESLLELEDRVYL